MPFYDFRCISCGIEFEARASMAEKAEKAVPCPVCGSHALETVFKSAPYAIASRSPEPAPACPNRHVCGAGCAHAH